MAWFCTRNWTIWTSFGVRGPGGNRTGSVVAATMSSLSAEDGVERLGAKLKEASNQAHSIG